MLGLLSVVQFLIDRFKFSYSRVNTVMLILAGSLLITRVYWTHDHESIISKTPVEVGGLRVNLVRIYFGYLF